MLKRFIVLIAIIFLPSNLTAEKPLIVTVQSVAIQPYDDVYQGVSSICHAQNKRFILSELPREKLAEQINENHPNLVLTIGFDALEAVKTRQGLPIIYSMILCSDAAELNRPKLTGVCMQVSVELQLQKMKFVFPGRKRIGLLFDPEASTSTVLEAQGLAPKLGLELLATAVKSPRDIVTALAKMKGKAEVIWMLPDITVARPRLMEVFTLFSFENKIPLVTYSEKYLEMGATMAIGLDELDIGRQVGDMANRFLSGSDVSSLPPVGARSSVITLNKNVFDKFGLELPKASGEMDGFRTWSH